ncbi:Transcription termination factor mtef18 protein [Thalictrum thalictroides]|uniref:Transcription termination factor mtef18 protein n=1 Tax=Thalictrum thalictroides TaxID=46969 RepID=A0A7J6WR06_THATH|nr:Transcription termination factor mtef18 protein [Thalictrum thalictroides]
MHFIRKTFTSLLDEIPISRHFSSRPKLPQLRKIPWKDRPRIIHEAQKHLTDYLHTTRSISFIYAERISKNSLFSLSNLISKVECWPSKFSNEFPRFLRYHPVNEFEFFLESIGIPFEEIDKFLPATNFFLSEQESILKVSNVLSSFGFPWNKLGMFYKEENAIFGKDSEALSAKLYRFIDLGFDNCSVVGICLAFPFVLRDNDEMSIEIDALFDVLKRVFIDCDMKSSVEGNVDACYEFCRKVMVFIDLGCEKKEVLEMMGKRWHVFHECSEEELIQKVGFFQRLDANKEEIGMLLLRCPEILHFDLESQVFSMMELLKQFGMTDEEVNAIALDYPYVLGKNKLANLPHSMRAIDSHKWFFDKITNGNHHFLGNIVIGSSDENLENDYKSFVERIQSTKTRKHAMGKLNFLLGIGFGENHFTLKTYSNLHGTQSELQERFNYLLHVGVEFPKLCKMVKLLPKVLNQSPEVVEQKLDFLFNDVGSTLQMLDIFPGFLCFDLENRMKPRYRIHMWLKERGFKKKDYSLASIVATSENKFIDRLVNIHPTVLKQWLERFSSKNHYYSHKEE